MQKREIDRNPKTPVLSDRAIVLLTQLCFRPDDQVEQADLIFVFSTPMEVQIVSKILDELLLHGLSKQVFVTGGIPNFDDYTVAKPESQLVLDMIHFSKYPNVKFYSESTSKNTKENVTEALKVLDFAQYKKVIFVFKSHAARRGYLTLKKYLPVTKLLQKTFSAQYANTDRVLNQETWHTYEFGKSRVWGEFMRIKEYGSRGDIAFDQEVSDLIDLISKEVNE